MAVVEAKMFFEIQADRLAVQKVQKLALILANVSA